jgi:hypothetical protein
MAPFSIPFVASNAGSWCPSEKMMANNNIDDEDDNTITNAANNAPPLDSKFEDLPSK